jgi:protein-L-isoaspartate(D-aspartate) O-methyltransferase
MTISKSRRLRILAAVAVVGLAGLTGVWSVGGFQGVESEKRYELQRQRMVDQQLRARKIRHPAVLEAMAKVPRHRFVPPAMRIFAYADGPWPIGHGQTISQPYIVALMTELIEPEKSMRVLEIGTGSGYQAAVLAECVAEVDSIEVVPELGRQAQALLQELGYRNIRVKIGDGYAGWPERAPYDAILLTAAPKRVPRPLLEQLKVGGKLVAPEGEEDGNQELIRVTRTKAGYEREVIDLVRFVPMTGKAQREP